MKLINKVITDKSHCPECGITWQGKDIFEHFLEEYTNNWPYKYARTLEQIKEVIRQYPELYRDVPEDLDSFDEIKLNAWYTAQSYGWSFNNPKCFGANHYGIEIPGYYDGVVFWYCTNCDSYFKRFEWSDFSKLEEENE